MNANLNFNGFCKNVFKTWNVWLSCCQYWFHPNVPFVEVCLIAISTAGNSVMYYNVWILLKSPTSISPWLPKGPAIGNFDSSDKSDYDCNSDLIGDQFPAEMHIQCSSCHCQAPFGHSSGVLYFLSLNLNMQIRQFWDCCCFLTEH